MDNWTEQQIEHAVQEKLDESDVQGLAETVGFLLDVLAGQRRRSSSTLDDDQSWAHSLIIKILSDERTRQIANAAPLMIWINATLSHLDASIRTWLIESMAHPLCHFRDSGALSYFVEMILSHLDAVGAFHMLTQLSSHQSVKMRLHAMSGLKSLLQVSVDEAIRAGIREKCYQLSLNDPSEKVRVYARQVVAHP